MRPTPSAYRDSNGGQVRPVAEDIDPRILYSADAAALAGDMALGPEPATPIVQTEPAQAQQTQRSPRTPEQDTRTLVVVDHTLNDVDLLLSELSARRAVGENIEWLLLDADTDGITAVTSYLKSAALHHRTYDAVQILTHGDAGQFELGSQTVNAQNLRLRATDFSHWSDALSVDADILIYGCDLTASAQGHSLVSDLALLTSADIASSMDTTGHESVGGNWILESQTGSIESEAIVSRQTAALWKTELSVVTQAAGEMPVNVPDLNNQQLSSNSSARQVASNGTDVITVWEDDKDIYYRISSVSGATNGSQVKLSNPTDADRHDPTVAMATDGSFVITWTGEDQDGDGIYAQQFDDSGNPKAGEFRVNATTSRDQFDPSVAIRNDGGFAISWTSDTVIGPGVRVSIYDANGISIQSERAPWISIEPTFASSISVNQTDNSMALAMTQTAVLSTGNDTLISLRLDPGGSLVLGSSYQWSLPIADITEPAITINSSGAYAIVARIVNGGQGDIGLFTMTPAGSIDNSAVVQVNQVSGQDLASPDVALSNTGAVLVAWESNQGLAGRDVYARQFNLSASPVGFETLVNQQSSGNQRYSSVVIHGQSASIVWSGLGPGDSNGVFRRLVDLATPGIVSTSPNLTTSEDGQFTDIGYRLSSQPIAAVTLSIVSNNTNEGTVSVSSLTFDTGNWNTPQYVRVTGVDDDAIDGNQTYNLVATPSSTTDTLYNALGATSPVALVNLDNELAISPITDSDSQANQIGETAPSSTGVGITAQATDPGHTITYSVSSIGDIFSIDPTSGVVTLATGAVLDYETVTSHNITVTAASSRGAIQATQANFTIDVLDANDNTPVVTNPGPIMLAENSAHGTVVADLSAIDPDTTGSPMWSIIGGSGQAYFSIAPESGIITVNSPRLLDYESTPGLVLDIVISDGTTTSASVSIDIMLIDQNEAPLGGPGTTTVSEDMPYSFSATDFALNDPDSGAVLGTIFIDSLPASGDLVLNGVLLGGTITLPFPVDLDNGTLVYIPPANAHGLAYSSFNFHVSDSGNLQSGTHTQTINIAPMNDAPVITSFGGTASYVTSVDEASNSTWTIAGFDPDGDALIWTLSGSDASVFSYNSANDELAFLAPPDYENPTDSNTDNQYLVQLNVRDSSNATDSIILTIDVNNLPETIALTAPGAITTVEDQTFLLTGATGLSINDDQNAPTLTLSISVDHGSVTLAQTNNLTFSQGDGIRDASMTFSGNALALNAAISALQFEPEQNFNGAAILNATVSDPADTQRANYASVNMIITASNDAPAISGSRSLTLAAGNTAFLGTDIISASDAESAADQITYRITTALKYGVLSLNGNAISAGDTFTQADLESGSISYTSASSADKVDLLSLTASDPDGASVADIQVSLTSLGAGSTATPTTGDDSQDNDSKDQSDTGGIIDSPEISADGSKESAAGFNAPASNQTNESATARVLNRVLTPPNSEADSPLFLEADEHQSTVSRSFSDPRDSDYENYRISDGTNRAAPHNQDISRTDSDHNFVAEYRGTDFQRTISELREQMYEHVVLEQRFVASSVAVSAGVSIGYVLWLLRGGALLSSLIASMPAWRSMDPLPVLSSLDSANQDTGDDDSLESMLEKSRQANDAEQASPTPEVVGEEIV